MTVAATGSAVFASSRESVRGIYTDFAPPNSLLTVLSIPVGTLVKQVDHQILGTRARPLASDFQPPNVLTGTFIKPKAPFVPAPSADNALHLVARWPATDFAGPNLILTRILTSPPTLPTDLMGDAGTARSAFRGVFSDFLAPNVVLTLPPPLRGPYVPVEVGTEINRKAVYQDFAPTNVSLNTISLIGAGQSFPGKSLDGFCPKPGVFTDFAPPNFLAGLSQVSVKAPFQPPEFTGQATRAPWNATDFQPENLLTGPFAIFLGNPPKVFADPYVYPARKPGIYDDSPQANFLTGPSSIVVSPPLSALDDLSQAWRPKSLPTDFIPPNLITGTLIAAAPPQPPGPVVLPNPGMQSLPYTFPDAATAYRRISEVVNRLVQGKGGASGSYDAEFQSGQVQYVGPSNQLAGSDSLIFGLAIPNPSGANGVALLLGSGGGQGKNVLACLLQDQAFDTLTPGNDLLITAGETQPGSSARGGNLTLIGGASANGVGGTSTYQGGTSLDGPGGAVVIQGGSSTGNVAAPGDVFILAGVVGNAGANVHLIATQPPGAPGYGVIRRRFNSTITVDDYVDGSMYLYLGGGFGPAGAPLVSGGPGQPRQWASNLATGTFSNGTSTLHIANGLIQSITTP